MIQSSVPWYRSKNGEITKRRNSTLPLSHLSLSDLYCFREQLKSIENAEQEPEIGVQDKVLVRTGTGKHHRESEDYGIHADRKCQWKPGLTTELNRDLPVSNSYSDPK